MSNGTFPHNLTAIDALTRTDHHYLSDQDRCYFLGEYTARQGYAYSDTNQLILNLKKRMDLAGTPQWPHKGRAIIRAARALQNAVPDDWLAEATFVPIPPSKARDDPLYDDRITKVLSRINPKPDVRDLLLQIESTEPAHDRADRPGPAEIRALYHLDLALCDPPPRAIALCDDVLTTGAHFRAAQALLQDAFPAVPIVGIFIARRVPEAADFEAIFGDADDDDEPF
jgi:hypothetical protein